MKFDIVDIQKLNPPGLWPLKSLAALIDILLKVVEAGIGGSHSVLVNSRMAARLSREFRRKKQENYNIRVKAWVMQCPERIAWVRGIIGERAIRYWEKNRLADYAFTEAFGDWKAEFPNGLGRKKAKPVERSKPKVACKTRTYIWKPFALQKIENVEGFLYGRNASKMVLVGGFDERREDYDAHWTVGTTDKLILKNWSQLRTPRNFNPVKFTPEELVPEAATGSPETKIETPETEILSNTEPENFPPPKARLTPNTPASQDVNTGLPDQPP